MNGMLKCLMVQVRPRGDSEKKTNNKRPNKISREWRLRALNEHNYCDGREYNLNLRPFFHNSYLRIEWCDEIGKRVLNGLTFSNLLELICSKQSISYVSHSFRRISTPLLLIILDVLFSFIVVGIFLQRWNRVCECS